MNSKKNKLKSIFLCQSCGCQRSKWQGQCPECGSWNSFQEENISFSTKSIQSSVSPWREKSLEPQSLDGTSLPPASTLSPHENGNGGGDENGNGNGTLKQQGTQKKGQKSKGEKAQDNHAAYEKRLPTKIQEVDRVLGGGLVPGSLILMGGEPGIGKSTLLLQIAQKLAEQNLSVLYASGEESVHQTRQRAERLHIKNKNILICHENFLPHLQHWVQQKKPQVLIVDSIQTLMSENVSSIPGSVSQIRECTHEIMQMAKNKGISTFLVGHITKEGHLAGPKVLEHMVDCVLTFEGDPHHQFRILRSTKNRYGPSNEMGVFAMEGEGLKEVKNPSQFFLSQREGPWTGSSIFPCVEGSRPFLCEIQALTSKNPHLPRRNAVGMDLNRMYMLTAIMEKHLKSYLGQSDVYINVVGGLKLVEPAADLATIAALFSTHKNVPMNSKTCIFGEVGLTGELRAVPFAEKRLQEGLKLGFKYFICPQANAKAMKRIQTKEDATTPLQLFPLTHLSQFPQCLQNLNHL